MKGHETRNHLVTITRLFMSIRSGKTIEYQLTTVASLSKSGIDSDQLTSPPILKWTMSEHHQCLNLAGLMSRTLTIHRRIGHFF